METKILKVTPEMAAKMLENKINNRRLIKGTVDYYANQMRRGQWKLTGQGLSFDINNRLIDGQNRLAAVIKANRTVEFLVITGVDTSTFDVYDSGKMRSSADVFYIHGTKNYRATSSIIGTFESLKIGFSETANGARLREHFISKIDLINSFEKNKEEWTKIVLDAMRYYSYLRIYRESIIGGFIAYAYFVKKHRYEYICSFLDQLFGIKMYENPTINRLTQMLIKDGLSGRKIAQKNKLALLIKVWNAALINRDLKVLKFTGEEEFPTIL